MNARLVFDLTVKYQDPAVVIVRYSTISLNDDVQGVQPPVTVCEDTTANLGAGLLRRTVKLAYSPEFLAVFPTLAEKKSALSSFGIGILNARLPGRVVLNKTPGQTDYEAFDCPP